MTLSTGKKMLSHTEYSRESTVFGVVQEGEKLSLKPAKNQPKAVAESKFNLVTTS